MVQDHIDELKELYDKGINCREISKITGISLNTLYAFFHHHRDIFPKRHKKYKRVTEETAKLIKLEWMNGSSITNLAKKYDVCEETVRRYAYRW